MVHLASLLPVVATLAGFANAHATVFTLWINGVDQGDGRNSYIRSPNNNDPIKDVSLTDIICNKNNRVVPKSVGVKGGDEVTFEWYHDNRGDDIIAESHKGPITVYIAPAAGDGAGKVWTKIAEDGYANGKWAVERLIANKGKYSMKLPKNLAAGDYLLRAEVIALHEGDTNYVSNSARGAQFYPSCSQIKVSGSGTLKLPGGYGFRTSDGGYTVTDPGILFNLYTSFTSYPVPGPKVFSESDATDPAPSDSAPSDPAPSDPAPSDPAPSDPAPSDPAPSDPAPSDSPAPAPSRTPSPSSPAPSQQPINPTPTPTPTPPKPTPTPKPQPSLVPMPIPTQPKDRNACFNEVNKCYAVAQPKGGMSSPEVFKAFSTAWKACQEKWKKCECI